MNGAGLPVNVLDDRGQPLSVTSDLAFVPGDNATNYPNPFRAGLETTELQYALSSATPVTITIYTVNGREVWNRSIASGAPGGQAGANSVTWDGRNANGRIVVDGVYIARITGGGADATIRIAVMK